MASKADLAKAGTMDLTAQDGKAYLEKNLTEWKKPGLLAHFDDGNTSGTPKKKAAAKPKAAKPKAAKAGKKGTAGKKPALAKSRTMAATAKEGSELLGGETLGDTRQMTKQAKKTPTKAAAKRATTMAKTAAEAKAIYGNVDTSAGRKRKAATTSGASPAKAAKTTAKKAKPKAKASPKKSPKKSPMKKARTMVNTAKEGQAFLKRKGKK